ncbi:hypothetical protein V8G54_000994 [Vigna mungo]|uniref:Uncharacterized protein n=1 Tax=Vigna mungo TaxID=3915 RepID=A0AAQ3P7F0_VIGMU
MPAVVPSSLSTKSATAPLDQPWRRRRHHTLRERAAISHLPPPCARRRQPDGPAAVTEPLLRPRCRRRPSHQSCRQPRRGIPLSLSSRGNGEAWCLFLSTSTTVSRRCREPPSPKRQTFAGQPLSHHRASGRKGGIKSLSGFDLLVPFGTGERWLPIEGSYNVTGIEVMLGEHIYLSLIDIYIRCCLKSHAGCILINSFKTRSLKIPLQLQDSSTISRLFLLAHSVEKFGDDFFCFSRDEDELLGLREDHYLGQSWWVSRWKDDEKVSSEFLWEVNDGFVGGKGGIKSLSGFDLLVPFGTGERWLPIEGSYNVTGIEVMLGEHIYLSLIDIYIRCCMKSHAGFSKLAASRFLYNFKTPLQFQDSSFLLTRLKNLVEGDDFFCFSRDEDELLGLREDHYLGRSWWVSRWKDDEKVSSEFLWEVNDGFVGVLRVVRLLLSNNYYTISASCLSRGSSIEGQVFPFSGVLLFFHFCNFLICLSMFHHLNNIKKSSQNITS